MKKRRHAAFFSLCFKVSETIVRGAALQQAPTLRGRARE